MVTGRLSVDFRNMLPLDTTCSVDAWFDREEGRKLHVKAHLTPVREMNTVAEVGTATASAETADTDAPHVYSEAQGLFIKLSDKSMGVLAENRAKSKAVLPMYSKL